MKARLATLLALTLMSGAVTAAVAPSAMAVPGSCTKSFLVDSNGTTYGVRAQCNSGTGSYRVLGTCTDELRGSGGTYYGPWVGIGKLSTLVCPYQGGQHFVLSNARFQYR